MSKHVDELDRQQLTDSLAQIHEHLFFGEVIDAALVLSDMGFSSSDAVKGRLGTERVRKAMSANTDVNTSV